MVKADTARMEIIHQSGNRNVFTKKLDLNSFESIRKFVDEYVAVWKLKHFSEVVTCQVMQFQIQCVFFRFKKCETKLHILINNAGIMALGKREETSDGLEMQIGTNHFGHFLLTNLLLPMLKESAPARIITVSR